MTSDRIGVLWVGGSAVRALPVPGLKRHRSTGALSGEPASAGCVDEAALQKADDRELAHAAAGGHRLAFDQLVERHRRSVYRLCYRFVGNQEDASDLAQDVFVRAYRGLGAFKGESSFATWLYRIGVNVCLNRLASKRPVHTRLEPDQHVDERGRNPVDLLLQAERTTRVRAAIARLPSRQRATLILRVYQECSHQEIAGILGSSVGAVKANFFHALNNLRRLLKQDEK